MALELALSAPGHMEPVVVERNGQLVSLSVPSEPQPFAALGYPPEPVIIGTVSPGMPAEKAGLCPGDTIVSVNGQQLESPYQLSELIQQSEGTHCAGDSSRGGGRPENGDHSRSGAIPATECRAGRSASRFRFATSSQAVFAAGSVR